MASTETQLLKFIWEHKGKAPWLRIIKELRFFSPNYCRLICESLIKNKFIKFSESQYQITALGRKELAKLGLIEKAEKVVKPKKPKKAKKKIGAKEIELLALTPNLIKALKKKGFRALEDIATTSVVKLEGIEGLTLGKAAKIINEARDKLRKEGKEYLWE